MNFEVCEPHTCTHVDARAQQAWHADGVLKITGIVPGETVARIRSRVVEVFGAQPADPTVWPQLQPAPLKHIMRDKLCMPVETGTVREAVNALIGEGWSYPNSGGTWFANAPTQPEMQMASPLSLVPRGTWHWDGRPDLHPVHGLWLFTPVTEMLPNFGGTWVVAGSARTVLNFYAGLAPDRTGKPTKIVRQWFADEQAWFGALNGPDSLAHSASAGAIRLMNVSGTPGDIVLMKNFTVHSAPEYIGPGPRVCHVIVASHEDSIGAFGTR